MRGRATIKGTLLYKYILLLESPCSSVRWLDGRVFYPSNTHHYLMWVGGEVEKVANMVAWVTRQCPERPPRLLVFYTSMRCHVFPEKVCKLPEG